MKIESKKEQIEIDYLDNQTWNIIKEEAWRQIEDQIEDPIRDKIWFEIKHLVKHRLRIIRDENTK